jgi:hypothetical protein
MPISPIRTMLRRAQNSLCYMRICAIGETQLMGNDVPPERLQSMRSVYRSLSVDSTEEAERIYKLLSDGGEVFMPIEDVLCISVCDAAGQVRNVVDDSPPEANACKLRKEVYGPWRPEANSNLRKWTAGDLKLADGLPLFQCW